MFDVTLGKNNEVFIAGRFDASQVEKAKSILAKVTGPITVDFKDLEYISSAGLGVLLGTQKRLSESGGGLKLRNLNKHIMDVFRYAGFDKIFVIE